ncbi:MAG: hypothetical protein H6730_31345 [Deltaproteobacteria bacterium]|nr:hypothetical protein [Deltaproteobacteria bacterium]
MTYSMTNLARHFALAGFLGFVAGAGIACGSGDVGNNNSGECATKPEGASVAQDGECCWFSINCQPGSICNTTDEADFYDPNETANVCIRVICTADADCDQGETCSPEKLCRPPVCQSDTQCPAGQTCQSGSCNPAITTDQVASCEVVTRSTSVREGGKVSLAAVAKNTNGAVLPGIPFEWTSDNTGAVSISGTDAVGGTEQGSASVSAKPEGRADLTCARPVSITNFPNVAQGDVRVVVVADDSGAAVADAQVILMAGGANNANTTADGVATFTGVGAVDSVTVIKAGWQYFTVVQPGTNDIYIPLPRKTDATKAGGFRGVIDISATKKADIKLGLAGPAIPNNLLDFGLETLVGDFVPTEIDAPELGLEDTIDLPGGLVLGLSNKTFTSDQLRCQGVTPGTGELGCFLTQTPAGPSAGWALAGQLKLAQVTSIANELSGAIGGGGSDLPIGDILTAVLPLLRGLNHGILASVFTEEFAKVNKDGQAGDCTDPGLEGYDDKCRGDFSKYSRNDIAASASLNVLSKVSVPRLPDLPGLGRCAQGAVLLSGAALEGRGLVPLGLTAGIDTLADTETPDCVIAGVEKPFGENSETLNDGEMPLSMAPPHSGIEGSQLFLLAVALDPDNIAADTNGNFQLSALIKRVDTVGETVNMGGAFPKFPEATISKGAATVAFDAATISGATLTRTELQAGGNTWLVYAPATAANVALPDVAEGRAVLGAVNDGFVLSMGMDGTYADMWSFGSGKTLDRLPQTITSFVVQQCTDTAGHPCEVAQ